MTELTAQFLRMVLAKAEKASNITPKDFVFLDDRNEPIRPDRLTKEAKKLMKRTLGLTSGAVHILRHTSLTIRHRQGVSLDDVRAIAGHANIKTTMLYLHSEPEHLRKELYRTPIIEPFLVALIFHFIRSVSGDFGLVWAPVGTDEKTAKTVWLLIL